ncbi:MAG: DUF4855 domain-containing protein, partial [Bacteroidota bacterium]
MRTKSTAMAVSLLVTAGVIGSRAVNATDTANLAQGRPYTVSLSAEQSYPDSGNRELTDGRKGTASYLSPEWSGYHVYKGQTVDIILDLGQTEALSNVTVGLLDHPAVGIMQPIYVAAGLSDDGEHWHVWDVVYTPAPASGEWAVPKRVTYTLPGSAVQAVKARYVRIHMPLQITVFVDEIEVTGVRGDLAEAKAPSSLAQAGLPSWPKGDQFDLAPVGPYRAPGTGTGDVHDVVLLPLNPPVRWDIPQLLPYITFGEPSAEQHTASRDELPWAPRDWLFDTVLFTPIATAPSGRFFHTFSEPGSVFEDWLWLIDTYFAPDGPLVSLEKSTAWAGARLGDAIHKVKVILALPSPNPRQTKFWSGIDEYPAARQFFAAKGLVTSEGHFSGTLPERCAILEWMIGEIYSRWQRSEFQRLE